MCTLTWSRPKEGGLEVWFNRDEKKTRPIADPPALRELNGVTFLSPRDPQGGGTWMLANEFGLVVCLLNKWELDTRSTPSRRKSRGQLVWQMGAAKSLDDLASFLTDLENYPAFTLIGISPEGKCGWEWNGETLSEVELTQPLTSSSYCFEDVKKAREDAFLAGAGGENYHASTGEESTAFTVRMNRPDAQTWSRSYLKLGEGIEWEYLAEQLDLGGEPERSLLSLPRK